MTVNFRCPGVLAAHPTGTSSFPQDREVSLLDLLSPPVHNFLYLSAPLPQSNFAYKHPIAKLWSMG